MSTIVWTGSIDTPNSVLIFISQDRTSGERKRKMRSKKNVVLLEVHEHTPLGSGV